jgi:lipooligosaccharide transport system permease protein
MSLSWRHAAAVWRRDLSLYSRTWKMTILPNFFEPVFYLTAIGVGVGAYVTDMAGMPYIQFLAPGLICVAAMNGASFEVTYNIFVRINFERAYDAILTTPVETDDILAGELMWALTRALIYGGGFYVVTAAFGLIPWPHGLIAILAIPLAGLLFASIGLAFTLSVRSIDFFSFYFTLFLTPLFLFSDVFFPLAERFSGPWLIVAETLPLLHPVRISRMAFQNTWSWVALWDLAYILAASGALYLVALRAIRRRLTS